MLLIPKYLSLVLVILVMTACNGTSDKPMNKRPSTMTEKDKRNIEAVKRMYQGDNQEFKTVSKDIIWHVPGHNQVSGQYTGYEEYTEMMPSKMGPLSKWEFKLMDVMVNGDYVVATFSVNGERKGKKINMKGAHTMRLNEQGQVVEGWGFADDQDVLDDFFTD